jgi:hypothetical protein
VLLWLAVGGVTAALVRVAGPAVLDPDEHAATRYFQLLVHRQRLGELVLSAPKPLLTVVDGVAWTLTHDWRAVTAVTVAAFALAVVTLARAAARLAGPLVAAAVVVGLASSAALVLQVARGNSVIWALAGWGVAADALARRRRRWGVAGVALLLASLARAESWLLLPPVAALALLGWRRGERRALLLLLPLSAPLLWFGHDVALSGDALYSLRVPERYSDLISGRQAIPPGRWLALLGRRYGRSPLLDVLAAAGVAWLLRRRAWPWLVGLGALTIGLLALLGVDAWHGTYISYRYFDPADAGVRVLAAFGSAWLWPLTRTARHPAGATRRAAGGAAALALMVAACWPLAPADQSVRATLARGEALSRNAASAIRVLRPLAAAPGTVLAVSGPQRLRVAVELGLPLGRVRDLLVATQTQPLDRALSGSDAVFHDTAGDQPAARFAPLTLAAPGRVGALLATPLLADPGRGLYVLRLRPAR